jgi:hypothetical protein
MEFVLLKAIMVMSIFGVPLGNPIFLMQAFPNSEVCETYKKQFLETFPVRMDLEHTASAQAQCMSRIEYNSMTGKSGAGK